MSGNRLTPRTFLAKEIKRAREAKGMSAEALANAVYVSESLVRAWEKGRRLPKPDVMTLIEGMLGTGGILGRVLDELVDASVPVEWFRRWVEIEREASGLWTFEPSLVPGLLQNESYARAVLRAANHSADLDEMVSARVKRQEILTKEDAPMFVALISEVVLRHNVGGPEVMVDQLEFLAGMAQRDNVIVQVIPDSSTECAGFLSGFVVASFDGGRDIAYVDNQLNGEVVSEAEELARLRRWLDVFRSDALSRRESLDLILKMVESWKK